MKQPDERDTHSVGYGRPPKTSQFKPGQSGNPKGRPKGAKSLDGHLDNLLQQRVKIKDHAGERHISKLEAVAMRLVETALGGDLKAMQFLLTREAKRPVASGSEDSSALSPSEQQLLQEVLEAINIE